MSQSPPNEPADEPADEPAVPLPAQTPDQPAAPRAPLTRRDTRPLFMHFAVDTVVAFLLLVIVLLFLGADIFLIIVVSVVVGAIAAPYTRRAEERALAKRPEA